MKHIYKENITGSTVIPKQLIDKVIQDERWSYEMPFFEFTKLVKYHSGMIEDPIIGMSKKDTTKKSTILQCNSTVLEQDEIDKLIMELTRENNANT